MKKVFALAALVAVALTSCVTNEVVTPEGEIAFKAVNYKNTKAGPITGTTYPTDEHFGVYAYHSLVDWSTSYVPSPYMYGEGGKGVEIWENGGVWKNHTKSYYWPKTGMLSFVAYSPYAFGTGTVSATATEGVAFTDFTTTNNFSAQIDLMATDVVKDQTAADGVVDVVFKHLLSQVKVAVKPAATNYGSNGVTSITIDRVVLSGVNSVADYASVDGAVVATGWSGHATPIAYTYLSDDPADNQTVTLTAATGAAVGTAALVIPQTNNTRQFTIDYTITYDGGAQDVMTNVVYNVPADFAWEMGKIYTYTVTIGVGAEITFDPSVSSDWVAGSGDTNISVG